MSKKSNIASAAFRAGIQGKLLQKTVGPTQDVHVNTKKQGPIEIIFEFEDDFPELKDRDSAYLVGRSLRISGYILDCLGTSVSDGEVFLKTVKINAVEFSKHNHVPWGPKQTARVLEEFILRFSGKRLTQSVKGLVVEYSESAEANHRSNPDNKPYL